MNKGIGYRRDAEGNDVVSVGKFNLVLTDGDETVEVKVLVKWVLAGFVACLGIAELIILLLR